MVNYGINSKWKINIKVGEYTEFYTGTIIEEDDFSLKIQTIKDELRVISKRDIISAKEYARFNNDYTKTAE